MAVFSVTDSMGYSIFSIFFDIFGFQDCLILRNNAN